MGCNVFKLDTTDEVANLIKYHVAMTNLNKNSFLRQEGRHFDILSSSMDHRLSITVWKRIDFKEELERLS